MKKYDFSAVVECLEQACPSVFPGATACVFFEGDLVFHHAAGHRVQFPAAVANTVDSIYDLASLTKAMAVGTLLMSALTDGLMTLDERVGPILAPDNPEWAAVTVRHLAGHTSGLPAWRDFGSELAGDKHAGSAATRNFVRNGVFTTSFDTAVGQRACYSDLGYMALGWYIEARLNAPLDKLLADQAERFALRATSFRPAPNECLAPTELDSERGLIHGEVHDPNAWLLGGVAGHAGLFGSAYDVACWAQNLVAAWHGDNTAVSREVLNTLWRPTSPPPVEDSTWRLCFDAVSEGASSSGQYFGSGAVGHLGYTGCSLWLEPDRQWVAVLLSNRPHPDDNNHNKIKSLRPVFHDLVGLSIQA